MTLNQADKELPSIRVGVKEINAARMAFFIPGFAMSTWAPMIPIVKDRLSLDADILGLLLLCIGVSGLLVMPICGMLTARFGCRKMIMAGDIITALLIVVLACLDSVWSYAVALLLFGAAMGIADVTMNTNAVFVEMLAKRRLLSSMQAFWSIGCFAGVGGFALFASLGLSTMMIGIMHCLVMLCVIGYCGRYWLTYQGDGRGKIFVVPRGVVIILGILAGILFLVEGAIMDWSGVLLNEVKGIELSLAGIGYAVFSATMLVMRLIGDRTVQLLGEKTTLLGGSIVTAIGFAMLVWSDDFWLNGLAFVFVGIGCSNILPVFYSILKYQKEMSVSDAVTALSSLAYAGVILGPGLLGFIAQGIHITAVFELIVVLMLVEAVGAKYVFDTLKR